MQKTNQYYKWSTPSKKVNFAFPSDGFGYYSFLPQYFLYYDQPYFTYLDKLPDNLPIERSALSLTNDPRLHHLTDRYFIGTSLFYSPFFAINTLYNNVSGGKMDGYSYSYQLSVCIGAMLYVFLSMLLIVRLFQLFDLSRSAAFLAILILYLGTNLGYYATIEFSLSHFPAFFMCTLFLYQLKKWDLFNRKSSLIYSAAAFALLLLIRPTDGIILLIVPFMFDSFSLFWSRIRTLFSKGNRFIPLIICAIVLSILSLQLLSNYYQSGHFFYYFYYGEGLTNITSPHIFNVLFSYKKGFFLYTPIMLLLFPSWIILGWKESYFGLGSFIVSFLFLWVIASWWQWYYGGSFGMRVLIDFYPLFVLVIFKAIQHISLPGKMGYLFLIGLGIYAGQVFEFQYKNGIIHYVKMNKQRYWHVFMKTDRRFYWYPYHQIELLPFREKTKPNQSRCYTYNSQTKKWEIGKQNLSLSQIKELQIVRFHTALDSSSITGLRISGKANIQSREDRDNAIIVYKKEHKTIDSIPLFFGNQTYNLHQFEPFHLEYFNKKNRSADSLIIYFMSFTTPRKLKDIKIYIDTYHQSTAEEKHKNSTIKSVK